MKRRCILLALMCAIAVSGAASGSVDALLAGIAAETPDARAEAWKQAGPVGAPAVVPLAQLMDTTPDADVRLAAFYALRNIAHHAGRPGAESERAAVAAELSRVLKGGYGAHVRREALHLQSVCGSDAEVPAVAALLAEEELAEDARLVLDRMPGPAATQALTVALSTAPGPLRARIAASLAHRSAAEAIPALREQALGDDREVAFACLAALGKLGVPPNAVFPMRPSFTDAERVVYGDALLDAAEALRLAGDNAQAETIYASISAYRPNPRQVCAALVGLSDVGSTKFVMHALGYLSEPDIRDVAMQALAESAIPDVDQRLEQALKQTDPVRKAVILRILDRRGAPAAEALLRNALNDPAPEVRVTAGMVLGVEPALDDVVTVATHGSYWTRGQALAHALGIADRLAAGEDPARARELFETLVLSDPPASYAVQAFAGLERIADAASLKTVEPYATAREMPDGTYAVSSERAGAVVGLQVGPETRAAAERAYVAIWAGHGDRAAAQARLLDVAENSRFSDVSALAAEKLTAMGVSPQILAQRRGYISEWRVLGPFPNPDNSAFGKSFIDEAACDGTGVVEWEGRRLEWATFSTESVPAVIGLRGRLEPSENVAAYAYAELEMDAARDVVFLIGSDDGCEFWVNGEKLHAAPEPRGMTLDQDRVEASLRPGKNRVLIKVLQGGVDWQFCVRVTDRAGTPVDLSATPAGE